jgi:hypothetical protein
VRSRPATLYQSDNIDPLEALPFNHAWALWHRRIGMDFGYRPFVAAVAASIHNEAIVDTVRKSRPRPGAAALVLPKRRYQTSALYRITFTTMPPNPGSTRISARGLRIALGAQPSGVLRWIAGQGMLVALAGIVVGLASAYGLSRVLSTLLFEIQPRDSVTFATVAALLFVVALTACLVPARRASRVDPIIALRDE